MSKKDLRHENDRITDGFDIFFWVFNDSSSYVPTHWHTALEINYILEGSVDVAIANDIAHLLPGDINIVDSNVLHSTKSVNGNKAILIQLPLQLLERYIPNYSELCFSFDPHSDDIESKRNRSRLIITIEEMRKVFEEKKEGGILKFNSLLFDLMYQLYHNFSYPKENDNVSLGQKNFDHIRAIIKYSEQHYMNPISIGEIASVVAFSEDYFSHFFKRNMGVSYLQYLNELRMSHVYKDLIYTDIPLKDILEQHGFTNYKLFRRMFQEKFHTTPGEYRKKYSMKNATV
ncbi:AraC family transcriptional regulator [Butyrivibrio sp. WCD3002]|uniref:AraC family transcriptional regulator n=1 Tax=Butyrivibrio sp. WCD3002 TaxID=1280676 RepID=UPI00041F4EFB|nr:AraC family transcriptional regulator [Butyrivibrio sp. WCD3002]